MAPLRRQNHHSLTCWSVQSAWYRTFPLPENTRVIVSASQPGGARAGFKPSTVASSWRGVRTAVAFAALGVAGMASSGCSMSYQLGSLFGKDGEKAAEAEQIETTGTTRASSTALRSRSDAI